MGPDVMILVFWILSFKPAFSLSSFTFIKRLYRGDWQILERSDCLKEGINQKVPWASAVGEDSMRKLEKQTMEERKNASSGIGAFHWATCRGRACLARWLKDPPAMQETGDLGLIPAGSERCHGGGNGNALQYSSLKNPMDRGAWWATVRGVTKSRTQLSDWQTQAQMAGSLHCAEESNTAT